MILIAFVLFFFLVQVQVVSSNKDHHCPFPSVSPARIYYWSCYSSRSTTNNFELDAKLENEVPIYSIGGSCIGNECNTSFVGFCGGLKAKTYLFSETMITDKDSLLLCGEVMIRLTMYQENQYNDRMEKVLEHKRCWAEWKKVQKIILHKDWHDGQDYKQFLSFERLPFNKSVTTAETLTDDNFVKREVFNRIIETLRYSIDDIILKCTLGFIVVGILWFIVAWNKSSIMSLQKQVTKLEKKNFLKSEATNDPKIPLT